MTTRYLPTFSGSGFQVAFPGCSHTLLILKGPEMPPPEFEGKLASPRDLAEAFSIEQGWFVEPTLLDRQPHFMLK